MTDVLQPLPDVDPVTFEVIATLFDVREMRRNGGKA